MRENTKKAAIIQELKSGWVPLTTLMSMNNWQKHSVRGLISTLKTKNGLNIETRKEEGIISYRIAEASES